LELRQSTSLHDGKFIVLVLERVEDTVLGVAIPNIKVMQQITVEISNRFLAEFAEFALVLFASNHEVAVARGQTVIRSDLN
jgi:hypothetical protein